ncbi:MAG: hypothetical protein NTV93_15845 [Verrucomicrobia bacterium]|nr:hypothetical protein [Verrucomicrobiota bacterium]
MLRITGYPLIFLAMFSIAGGHWAVLQAVAWTGMAIEYSRDSSLAAALTKTFSGKAPCKMCKTIEAGKEKESRLPATVKADKKIDKFLARAGRAIPAPPETKFSYPLILNEVVPVRPVSPPAPVPIAA